MKRARKRQAKLDYEVLPKRESVGGPRNYGYNAKEIAVSVRLIRKYLESQVGKPWDQVYSEISQATEKNAELVRHYIWFYVERDIKISDDGIPVKPSGQRASKRYTVNGKGGWIQASRHWGPHFYTENGVLKVVA